MSAVEALVDDENREPEGLRLIVNLDHDAAGLLTELMRRTGFSASELVGWSLGAYWRELEGIVLPPPMSQQRADAVVAEGEAAFERGDFVDQDEMFERLRQKYGG